MRDFSKIIQNLLLIDREAYRRNPLGLARMWVHECNRVYLDRLILPEDIAKYQEYLTNGIKEFSDFKPDLILAEPLIFTSFIAISRGHEVVYNPIKDMDELKKVLEDKLE